MSSARRSGAIKLTTQRYYTPSGRSIQAKGIEPDIEVRPARIESLENGRPRRSERDLRGALKNEEEPGAKTKPKTGAKDNKDPKKDGKDKTDEPETSDAKPQDYQLDRALDLLRGVALFRSKMVN